LGGGSSMDTTKGIYSGGRGDPRWTAIGKSGVDKG
ncbi:unnamed protein product, partial [marine sediment metagenome]